MAKKPVPAPKAKAQPKKKAAVAVPEKFTANSMVKYLSEKNDLPQKAVKALLEDMYELLAVGAMKGARVPIGAIGKLYVAVRPARKARIGKNPITGEQITIAAKKATKVPKFRFSATFKERSLKAVVKK
ncbi:MAG: HU family DNA-binding protein [Candidatus Competibacteraceae bacterium]|nr:HU family DNA-binding protein [Candidatus Competibacteraceae bacterium]